MTPHKDPAQDFGFLQYASTCLLVAFGLSWGYHGLFDPNFGVARPVFEFLAQNPWFKFIGAIAIYLIQTEPGLILAKMIACWPVFVFCRNRARLGGIPIIFGGTVVIAMISVIFPVLDELSDPSPDFTAPRIWIVMWETFKMGSMIGLSCSVPFWIILRFWLWRRTPRTPPVAETFR